MKDPDNNSNREQQWIFEGIAVMYCLVNLYAPPQNFVQEVLQGPFVCLSGYICVSIIYTYKHT